MITYSSHNSLYSIIAEEILENKSISVARYMELCNYDEHYGFYQQKKVLGKAGHFITAPEINQVFGEIIGAWFINVWMNKGSYQDCILLEIGAGAGTLMSDILRCAERICSNFLQSITVAIMDINPFLIQQQQTALRKYEPVWINNLDELPKKPIFVIANEFFDVLPIMQFIRIENQWEEIRVTIKNNNLAFVQEHVHPQVITEDSLQPSYMSVFHSAELSDICHENGIYEVNIPARNIMRKICQHILNYDGHLVNIDYGYDRKDKRFYTEWRSTLQTVRHHQYTNPLETPGMSDMSAHVDFGALAAIAKEGCLQALPLVTQRDFLLSCGIEERIKILQHNNPHKAQALQEDLIRLTHPKYMGNLFKVMLVERK